MGLWQLTLKVMWTSFADFCTDWLFPYFLLVSLTDFFHLQHTDFTENIYRILIKQTGQIQPWPPAEWPLTWCTFCMAKQFADICPGLQPWPSGENDLWLYCFCNQVNDLWPGVQPYPPGEWPLTWVYSLGKQVNDLWPGIQHDDQANDPWQPVKGPLSWCTALTVKFHFVTIKHALMLFKP